MKPFCLVLFAGLIILSCKKTEVYTNDGLIGKWKLKEIFSGYAMGGNFQWNLVPPANFHLLEFYDNGTYEVATSLTGGGYNGNYTILNDSTLARTFSNQVNPVSFYNHKITLSASELIIDYPNIEGVIRYKYELLKIKCGNLLKNLL